MLPTNYLTATETIPLIGDGETTAKQVIQDHRNRIDERDAVVRAWVTTKFDTALKDAESTKGLPLHGVVVGVKDIIDMPTEMGSPMYKGNQPSLDAPIVDLIRAAGATIIGKTTTAEFAVGDIHDPTTNPFDKSRKPGGSSSGSAAAVADYQCHIALASQTAASLIRPASYCGVFGYKPTWGTISLDGVKGLMPSADSLGVMTRSITDAQLFARAVGIIPRATSKLPATRIEECKFAFIKTDQFGVGGTNDLPRVWTKAQKILVDAGAKVEELDLGKEFDGWMDPSNGRYVRLSKAEGGISIHRELTIGKDQVGETLAGAVENDVTAKELNEIRDQLAALRPRFDAIARGYDGIFVPSAPCEAPKWDGTSWIYFASLWTGLHVPTVHMPGFSGEGGMPMGLSLLGPRHSDERLLEIAKAVAPLFIGADEGKLKAIPAPEGAVHLRP